MSWPENRIVDIDHPHFILDFNINCVSFLLPPIEASIKYVENAESSLPFILLLILSVQIIRASMLKEPQQQKEVSNNLKAHQLSKEVKDLKRELKSIQNMIVTVKERESIKIRWLFDSQLINSSTNRILQIILGGLSHRNFRLATEANQRGWHFKKTKIVVLAPKISHSSAKQLSRPSKASPQSSIYHQPEQGLTINNPLKREIKQQEQREYKHLLKVLFK